MAPALNDAVLDELHASLGPAGERVVAKLIGLFLGAAPETAEGIRFAAEAGDAHGLARAAHRLRGDAATIGAAALEALCAQAEVLGWAGDLGGAGGLVDPIAGEVARVETALRERLSAAA